MSEQHVLVETKDGLCTITFNRPEKKNAFTVAMYTQCVEAVKAAHADPKVRCILFTGNGPAFTSGNDLFDFMNSPPTGEDSPVFQFLLSVVDAEKPIVSAINGLAIGIGVTFNLHVDLAIASDQAKFTMPFVSLGLVPEGGSSYLLPRMAGNAKATEALLLAEPFDAQTAQDIGLVARVVPHAELMPYALAKCRRFIELPAAALRESKKLMRSHNKEAIKKALYDEAMVFAMRLGSPEAAEAFASFFEKRKPDFSKFE
jgi:enoyl-CoA hydratase/carnithine racemase